MLCADPHLAERGASTEYPDRGPLMVQTFTSNGQLSERGERGLLRPEPVGGAVGD